VPRPSTGGAAKTPIRPSSTSSWSRPLSAAAIASPCRSPRRRRGNSSSMTYIAPKLGRWRRARSTGPRSPACAGRRGQRGRPARPRRMVACVVSRKSSRGAGR
jgi:hypothetical protein